MAGTDPHAQDLKVILNSEVIVVFSSQIYLHYLWVEIPLKEGIESFLCLYLNYK